MQLSLKYQVRNLSSFKSACDLGNCDRTNRARVIRIGNKNFNTPTAAAKAIVDRSKVNGWTWCYIKDSSGEWVRLSEYKG